MCHWFDSSCHHAVLTYSMERVFSLQRFINVLFIYFLKGAVILVPFLLIWHLATYVISIGNGVWSIVLTIIAVILCGYYSENFLIKDLLSTMEKWIRKVPFVNIVYKSFKDLTSALANNKIHFNQPVYVDINGTNDVIVKIGFITNSNLDSINLDDYVSVFVPQCFGFSGELMLVKKANIKPITNVDNNDIVRFVMSAGFLNSEEEKGKQI